MIYLIVAGILSLFFIIIAGLLLVSFHISLHFYKKDSLTGGRFRIKWLGITFLQRRIPEEKREEKKKEEKGGFNWGNITEMGSLFTESYPSFMNILKAFIKSIAIKKLSISLNFGLGSSSDTAIASGYLWGFASIVNNYSNVNLSIEPDFQKERLDGSILVELRVRLIRIVVSFIGALTKKPVRKMIRKMRE